MTVASSQKVGRVIDLSWAPLPQPVGGGAVVALALEDGSLAFADTSQAVEHSSRKQRMQAFKHMLGGSWPYPQVLNLCCLALCLSSTGLHSAAMYQQHNVKPASTCEVPPGLTLRS